MSSTLVTSVQDQRVQSPSWRLPSTTLHPPQMVDLYLARGRAPSSRRQKRSTRRRWQWPSGSVCPRPPHLPPPPPLPHRLQPRWSCTSWWSAKQSCWAGGSRRRRTGGWLSCSRRSWTRRRGRGPPTGAKVRQTPIYSVRPAKGRQRPEAPSHPASRRRCLLLQRLRPLPLNSPPSLQRLRPPPLPPKWLWRHQRALLFLHRPPEAANRPHWLTCSPACTAESFLWTESLQL